MGRFQDHSCMDLFHSAERMESNQYDIVYRILLDKDYEKLLPQPDLQIYGCTGTKNE